MMRTGSAARVTRKDARRKTSDESTDFIGLNEWRAKGMTESRTALRTESSAESMGKAEGCIEDCVED
jgi:hypothetical protein